MQLAKNAGAEVTAVDSSGKLEMLRSLGADHVLDYQQEDFTKRGEHYDVIIDVIGKSQVWRQPASLKRGGVYVLVNAALGQKLFGGWIARASGKRIISGTAVRRSGSAAPQSAD